jgi:hypothetical protein
VVPLPRLFVVAGKPRSLWILAAVTLLSGAAMLPAMNTMADHGASLTAFEFAGSVSRSQEIVSGWGEAGKMAAWWQLALDMPFLISYGLFLAGACAAVAGRAERTGRFRIQRAATLVAWFGPIAAGADLLQNISLALILSGREVQPWPRISALGGRTTGILMAVGLAFALAGAIATRTKPTTETVGETRGVK